MRLSQMWADARAQVLEKNKSKARNTKKKDKDDGEFDVERVRFEVLKFGIDNDMERERRLNAKQKLLVQLGAKPPKNQYLNYKKLKEQLKAQKEEQHLPLHSLFIHFQMMGQKSTIKSQLSKRKSKKQRSIDITAGYGKLRNGELIVGKDTRKTFKRIQMKAQKMQQGKVTGRIAPR
ncbi:uncharacterized protein C1orf131-like isoform X3 [Varroa jacobsoni]|uniref:uncharacterized protein C1orf131-like isoform X3 n=1 Tax=Varroa jacobsoni TaxID=62625 RepID=UPI000BF52764|nr:uncharacterized protein C1orf131-like isoform X3 [Varroa jacobsoni]